VEERDDFAMALASLTPASGNGVSQQFGSPRWTAELVALTEAESALILEQEMQKAVAAMAAVQAEAEGRQSPVVESVATVSVQEPPQAAAPDEATSLVAAMMNQTALPTLSDLVDSVLPRASDETTAPEMQGAAFAAAAAGNADAVSQSAMPSSEVPQAAPKNAEDQQRESELAAAWESWKHIRESVVETQFKSQVAEAIPEPPAAQVEQVASPESESDGEANGQEESVASIVDSVLADLKPKLMAEISKKMGKEKKRK
jgi:hypothetical protein